MNMGVLSLILAVGLIAAAAVIYRFTRTTVPAIPIIMFHKVDDSPKDPESIGTRQLEALFTHMWNLGFCPVNMSDILRNRVDDVVPKGRKPVGITSDDSHPSMLFSRHSMPSTATLQNERSFVEVLSDSLKPFGLTPRASLFLGRVGDDRVSTEPDEYFGGCLPLPEALAILDGTPGVEAGYHTVVHKSMTNMNAAETRATLEEQRKDFETLGVLEKVVPVVAYPYGHRPSPEGLEELRDMGFLGAVVTNPGLYGRWWRKSVPLCKYNGTLLSDRFTLPRISVGAYAYPRRATDADAAYVAVDPIAVFQNDVLGNIPNMYSVPE